MKKRAFAFLLCIALMLSIALPTALATSEDPQEPLAPAESEQPLDLFDQIMECETEEEIMTLVEGIPEEELLAFEESLSEEQIAQLEQELYEAPAEEPQPVAEDYETEDSEIIYIAVNFTEVAPFGAPIEG